ncbi:EAL domain-containing protein [Thalassotalea piscium]|uniref:EAL domain-containing protein (Putative c-di-GMP-specific phosphodiesterase class I)/GGDEF domain-containing protein n=1 Tax=Thalassotalea piscium TaxID=1230533 RepID=A0A7X0TTY3_9GAMM|nr:GGDEF domain-containing protein [Thalassotalea piscium]MBB6543628.1 EAL domain-containing protein (putative c-di-GMP-specific phosphodiesterase class I)/GGDEF domain-containing protein [Thalassotalea piscium]
MYTYSQLLFRNIIFGLLFSLATSAIAVFLVQQLFIEQQQQHRVLLTQITAIENIEYQQLFNHLNSAFNYKTLIIKNSKQDALLAIAKPLSFFEEFLLPSRTSLTTKDNLSINFQISVTNEINFLMSFIIAVFVFSIVASIIAGWLSLNRYTKVITQVSEQIKLGINRIISPNTKQKDSKYSGVINLPSIQTILTDLQALLNKHIEGTSKLEKEAYVEPLTQLDNRSRFVQFFDQQNESVKFGVLTITRCSELQTINQIHGYNEGDNYICKVADIMKSTVARYQGAQLFRLNSSDFATILPNVKMQEAERYAQLLTDQFNHYQQASDLDSVAYTGLVAFDTDKPLGELLALVDTGISIAQTKKINAWYAQKDSEILESSSASYGNQNWRQEIDSVIENQRVTLLVQHIKPSSRNNKVYSEVLARFLNSNDEMLPTASFIAMAEKLDKIVAIDRMIVDRAIEEIKQKNMSDHHFGINLSARTIHDEHFLIWLERRLLKDSAIASKLVFEITEYGLQQNIKTSKRFIDMVHRVGSRLTVERFGVGLTSFKFFRDLKPDFIKMDSTYTRDIDEDKNNQYFLRLMVDLAHRLSITVLAESVETQEEKFTLEKLFIDGCQGFYIGKPEPI